MSVLAIYVKHFGKTEGGERDDHCRASFVVRRMSRSYPPILESSPRRALRRRASGRRKLWRPLFVTSIEDSVMKSRLLGALICVGTVSLPAALAAREAGRKPVADVLVRGGSW